MSPIVPTSLPLYSARCACEQSSMTGRPCRRAMSITASMSTGTPNRWMTMIALVRSVIRRSMSAALWLNAAPGAQSENTGMAFWSMMPSTEPMSVTGAVMTLVARLRIDGGHGGVDRAGPRVGRDRVPDPVASGEAVLELPHLVAGVPVLRRLVYDLHELVELGLAEGVDVPERLRSQRRSPVDGQLDLSSLAAPFAFRPARSTSHHWRQRYPDSRRATTPAAVRFLGLPSNNPFTPRIEGRAVSPT